MTLPQGKLHGGLVLTSRLLPPAGPLRRYMLVSLVDATGTGIFLAAGVLFFTRVLGLPAGLVAIGLSVSGLAAMGAALPLGSLGDRIGHRRAWAALTVVQALAFAAYPLVRSFPLFLVVVTLAAVADAGGSAVRGAYLSQIATPEQRVRVKAGNQAVSNAGFALGALGAGIALGAGTRAAYLALILASAASYAVCAAVLLTLPAGSWAGRERGARSPGVLRDRPYLAVCVLNGLLMTYGAILTVALPLWIVRSTRAPAWTVGGVFLLNTVLAVLLQVRASRGADTVPGAARAVVRSGVLLLLACLVFAVTGMLGEAGAVCTLAAGIALLTGGEVLQSAGGWGLSYALAPEQRQGQYLGAFTMGTRIYDTAGPVLVSGLVLGLGAAGWVVLGLLFPVLAAGLAAAARWAGQPRVTPESAGRQITA